MQKAEYAIYRDDEFLGVGTAKYLSQTLGIKEDTVRFLASPTNIKRLEKRSHSRGALVAVKLGVANC